MTTTTTTIRPTSTTSAFGRRSQVGGTLAEIRDLRGNRDGIWNNEAKPAGAIGDAFQRNPLALKALLGQSVGLTARDEIAQVQRFRADAEKAYGCPVMDPRIEAQLEDGALFAAQKAIALQRLGRTPADVTERFVDASGSVDGTRIAPARIFTQHHGPVGTATGDVVVLSPGFLETGQAFLDEVARLTQAGAHVVVMDHQWAGHTSGKRGGIANGESIALHTAAVMADVWKVATELYGDKAKLTVVGESMGGGSGALGAVVMNEAGRLTLDSAAFPPGAIDLVLQAPFLGATPGLLNTSLAVAASLPFVNRLAMPAIGVPDFVDDKRAEHLVAQQVVLQDIRAQLRAFTAADPFIARIGATLDAGVKVPGFVHVIHDEKDPLADFAKSKALVARLGNNAALTKLGGGNHGLSASDADLCADVILGVLAR